MRALLIALLVLAACGDATGPEPMPAMATIRFVNDSGFDVLVEVHVGRCDARVEPVASLEPGEGHVAVIDPGCWRVAVYGHAAGQVTTLCGTRLDVRAGETVRLRF